MYKNDKVIRRYSESFKLKILDELTSGKLNKYQLGITIRKKISDTLNIFPEQEFFKFTNPSQLLESV